MPKFGWTAAEIYMVAGRAHELQLQGRYREAAVIFEGLVALDPESAYCRKALASAYLASGRPEEAVEQLRRLLSRDSGDLDARVRFCEALIWSGDTGPASRELEALEILLPAGEIRRLGLLLRSAPASASGSNLLRRPADN